MEKKKSGAKPKYSNPTTMVSFRCPENMVSDFKEKVSLILKTYELDKVVEKKSNVPTMQNPTPPPPKKETTKKKFKCGCWINDKNTLVKPKGSNCNLYKSEHKF